MKRFAAISMENEEIIRRYEARYKERGSVGSSRTNKGKLVEYTSLAQGQTPSIVLCNAISKRALKVFS